MLNPKKTLIIVEFGDKNAIFLLINTHKLLNSAHFHNPIQYSLILRQF